MIAKLLTLRTARQVSQANMAMVRQRIETTQRKQIMHAKLRDVLLKPSSLLLSFSAGVIVGAVKPRHLGLAGAGGRAVRAGFPTLLSAGLHSAGLHSVLG